MNIKTACAVTIGCYMSVACATIDGPADPRDPFESYNRTMHAFNDSVDAAVIRPVAETYRDYVPDAVSKGVSNVFSNLNDVIVVLNDVLQLKFAQAASDTARVFFNSTIGLLGIFDVATHLDLPKHNEDFGQTLGYWGVPPGPYLVLPFFGPRNVRDSIGLGADVYFDPTVHQFDVRTRNGLFALEAIDDRASLLFASDLLQQATQDQYSFIRDAYLQRRRYYVHDGDPPDEDEEAGEPVE